LVVSTFWMIDPLLAGQHDTDLRAGALGQGDDLPLELAQIERLLVEHFVHVPGEMSEVT
jgi:hypothetical protein